MAGGPDLGYLYGDCRLRVVDLVANITHEEAALPVPACPGWTVHDVVAHLTGGASDGLTGNLDGAPGPAWTARQVEARKDRTLESILQEWEDLSAQFEQLVATAKVGPAVADVASHEQDIRAALDIPGHRDNDAIRWCATWLVSGIGGKVTRAGLPAVRVRTEDGEQIAGDGVPTAEIEVSRYELFRAVFGRRSRNQIAALFNGADGEPYVDHFCIFGPATADVVE